MNQKTWRLGALLTVFVAMIGCSSGGGVPEFKANFFGADVRIDTDAPGAADSKKARVACNDDALFVVFRDDRNGQDDIFFNMSVDGGATWQPLDTRLDTDVAGVADSGDPQISVSGNNLYVAWEDERNGPEGDDIYFQRSLDGGQTWLVSDVRLDADAPGDEDSGDVLVSARGRDVVVVWEEDRNGGRDVFARFSADAGTTWGPERIVNTNGAGVSNSDRPRIARAGDRVYVVWHDNRNGDNDIYLNVSLDGGATWGASDVRLDTDVAGADFSFDPEIHVDGKNVNVVWADDRNVGIDIYLNHSSDGGATWLASDVRMDTDAAGVANSTRPQVRQRGKNIYVAWIDTRSGTSDVRMRVSNDGGKTFVPTDARVDTDASGLGNTDFVQLHAAGDNVYVAWEDTRDGARDVRFNFSADAGATMQPADLRLDTDAVGVADSRLPRIDSDGVQVFVIWRDARNGENDIYVNSSLPK